MEPLMHLFIPLAFLLLVFPKLNRKQALLFSLLAILPDIDFLTSHRGLLHNIFVLIIISAIFFIYYGKSAGLLSLYFYGSHILLDLTGPGVAFLYPLTNKLFKLNVMLSSNPANPFDLRSNISLTLNSFIEATKPQIAPFFTTSSLLFLILIIILIIARLIYKKCKQ